MEIRWKSKELGCRIIALVIVFSVLCSLIGSIKSKAETKKRYIVLVLDISGDSNFYDENLENLLYSAYSPMDEVKRATLNFINSISSAKDTYVAIISYSSAAKVVTPFTNSLTQLKSDIQGLSKAGGRKNMGDGLKTAEQMFDDVPASAEKTVIIVTPGMTDEGEHSNNGHWSMESEGSTWLNSDSGIHLYEYANSAYEYALKIKNHGAKIYTIGLIKAMESCPPEVVPAAALFKSVLKDIATENCYFPVENVDEFEVIFDEMTQNVIKGKKGTFEFAATDEKYDYFSTYYYEDDYFDRNAEEYNPSLATMSLCLAISAFGANGVSLDEEYYNADEAQITSSGEYLWPNGVMTKDKIYKNQWTNAENLLNDLGFDHIEKNTDYKNKPGTDTIGVIVGLKNIHSEGGDYTLIALATRGGNYFSEWAGNFNIGLNGNHKGFEEAKEVARTFLNWYIDYYYSFLKGTVKLWMAGYSRGGAVVNLLAGEVSTDKTIGIGNHIKNVVPQNIFAYCFEPPRGLNTNVCSKQNAESYTNIHNIVNPNDIVPLVAMEEWDFTRYGTDHGVIPDPEYTSTYNDAAAKRMLYYQTFNTQAVKDSYVSLKEYEKHYDEVIEKAKNKFRYDYTIYPINHWNEKMEEIWNKIVVRLGDGQKKFECEGFSVDATEYEGYGIFENLYEYIIGIGQMRKLVKNYNSHNPYDGRLTDLVSKIDLYRKYYLSDTLLSIEGITNIFNQEHETEYEIVNMGDINLAVINRIATNYPSREIYANQIQEGLMKLVDLIKRKESPINMKELNLIKVALGESIGDRLTFLFPIFMFECFEDTDSIVDIIYDNIIGYCRRHGVKLDEYFSSDERVTFKKGIKGVVKAVVKSVENQNGTDDLYSLIQNANLIGMAHYPELCLAWLQSQDINYAEDNKRIYVPSSKRILIINCPVDVEVYDSSGELKANIIDNVPYMIPGSSINSSFTIEGGKKICLPLDEEYKVVIKATDNGKMDIAINVIGMDGVYRYIENYYDITLCRGDTYNITLSKDFTVDAEGKISEKISGATVSNMDGILNASIVLRDQEASDAKYEVKVDVPNKNGGICAGGGEYILGSYAVVRATEFEDCSFTGWYEGERLVSENREYRFRVMSDRVLSAHFEGETKYGRNGIFSIHINAGEGGVILGDKIITALDGYAVQIKAMPYPGYEFDTWVTEENVVIDNMSEEVTTLTLIDEDATVSARFKKKQNEDIKYVQITDEIKVSYETETSWCDGYNGKIVIYNNSAKDICEWKLDFTMHSDISDIWNAQLLNYADGNITVKDAGWNANIASDSSISFGFTAVGDQVVEPTDFIFSVKKDDSCEDGCKVEFIKTSEWVGGCIGEIIIKNNSDKTITDWTLEFKCKNTINGIWNGILESYADSSYIVRNAGYNYSIEPGASINIGVNISLLSEDIPNGFILTGK
jgi:hypothetical protein